MVGSRGVVVSGCIDSIGDQLIWRRKAIGFTRQNANINCQISDANRAFDILSCINPFHRLSYATADCYHHYGYTRARDAPLSRTGNGGGDRDGDA
jgi:hypothetical protein